jgi:hypothetical protein
MHLNEVLNSKINPQAILIRLKSKCVVAGEPSDPHWIYKGSHKGDGQFYLTAMEVTPLPRQVHVKGRYVSSRKLAYLIAYKEIPSNGKYIKTICGVTACMNPDHLSIPGQEQYEQEIALGAVAFIKKQEELSRAKKEEEVQEFLSILEKAKPVERYKVVK